ncbi:MAG: aminoacyl-tRNA hydrolase, partial [Candidatus Thorarchaeota archaeon]
PELWKHWFNEGQKKVAVKVGSEEELLKLEVVAASKNLLTALIRDAGMTELPPGTVTVLGIGPAKIEDVDLVTGELKLL